MRSTIEQLLQSHGFELARQKKHKVFKRDDGTTFVTASTPSDWRAERAQISALCRVLHTDKRTLLASLDRRRRRANVVAAATDPPFESPQPSIPVQTVVTKEERKFAKRLGRIERNRAEKVGRHAERLEQFFKKPAVLFVDRGEIVFADNRGVKRVFDAVLRRIERHREETVAFSERYVEATEVSVEELMTNPDLLCIFNCPRCGGMSFIFKDGSVIESDDPNAAAGVRAELKGSA